MADSSDDEKAKSKDLGLIHLVFSWTLKDILNQNLYKHKVEKIPETFSSTTHYLRSYIYPLLEETREDMFSNLMILSQQPTCRILSVEQAEGFNPSKNLSYKIKFDTQTDDNGKREIYKPESMDVFALTDVRPVRINDLNRPRRSYLPAVVIRRVGDDDNPDLLIVLTSKPILGEKGMQRNEPLFAVFFMNITTNIRIWNALHGGNLNIIKEVLHADSSVGNSCNLCISRNYLHADLQSFNLNESQINAVLTSISISQCNHTNSVRIIWGPPGTGKTKTVGTLLWGLLKIKCRTVTCAPTNTAVVEVTSRLVKLVKESLRRECYGLGDIVLFGNRSRMKIDDHNDLLDVFLDYRVDILKKCFAPLSGWKHQLDSMICLLEDPSPRYLAYLENKKKEEKKEEDLDHNKNRGEGETGDNVLTFVEFLRNQFVPIEQGLSFCIRSLCTYLPTSFISVEVVENMTRALVLLESLGILFHGNTLTNEELMKIFVKFEDLKHTINSMSVLSKIRNELLEILISLRKEFSVPDFYDNGSIRKFCLKNACLIFCTASSTANLHESKPLELLVIDEAAQLKECESAIPLQLPGVRHAILIGDECQLSALVKSKISEKAEFGRSLFERLVSLGQRKHLLNIQYRMHPSISLFPNSEFYDNQISDAPNVKERSYMRNFLQGKLFGSYSFINVAYGKEEFEYGHSPKNMVEVAVVSEMVASLFKASVAAKQKISVGVISPYKTQVFALNNELGNKYGTHGDFSVSVRSVDGFQGGEEDVIIISTVRSNGNGKVGFLSNRQRTNVALTRARYSLWILGNGTTLINSGSVWKKLILDAKNRGCFFNADEDKRLGEAIIVASVKLHHFDDLRKMNSLLFSGARWKVMFEYGFWRSMSKLKIEVTLKKVVSLMMKLSCGWRNPPQKQRNLNVTDMTSSQLLEQYEVDGLLYLLWTVDILKEDSKYIQVLKFWDVLPQPDIPELANRLKVVFKNYTVKNMEQCKLKCHEGDLEVPMSWEISTGAVIPNNINGMSPVQNLSSQLDSLILGAEP